MPDFKSSKQILSQVKKNLNNEESISKTLNQTNDDINNSIEEYKEQNSSIVKVNQQESENLNKLTNSLKSFNDNLTKINKNISTVVESSNSKNTILGGILISLGQVNSVLSAFRADYLMAKNGNKLDGHGYYNANLISSVARYLPDDQTIHNMIKLIRETGQFANVMSNSVKPKIGNNKMADSDGSNGLLEKLINKFAEGDEEIKQSLSPIMSMTKGMLGIDDSSIASLTKGIGKKIGGEKLMNKYINPFDQMIANAKKDEKSAFKRWIGKTVGQLTGFGNEEEKERENNPELVMSALAPYADDIVDIVKTEIETNKAYPMTMQKLAPYAELVWVVNSEYQENGLENKHDTKTTRKNSLLTDKIIELLNGTANNTKDDKGEVLFEYDKHEDKFTGTLVKPMIEYMTSISEYDLKDFIEEPIVKKYINYLIDNKIIPKKPSEEELKAAVEPFRLKPSATADEQKKTLLLVRQISQNENNNNTKEVRNTYKSKTIEMFNKMGQEDSFLEDVFSGIEKGGILGVALSLPGMIGKRADFEKDGKIKGVAKGVGGIFKDAWKDVKNVAGFVSSVIEDTKGKDEENVINRTGVLKEENSEDTHEPSLGAKESGKNPNEQSTGVVNQQEIQVAYLHHGEKVLDPSQQQEADNKEDESIGLSLAMNIAYEAEELAKNMVIMSSYYFNENEFYKGYIKTKMSQPLGELTKIINPKQGSKISSLFKGGLTSIKNYISSPSTDESSAEATDESSTDQAATGTVVMTEEQQKQLTEDVKEQSEQQLQETQKQGEEQVKAAQEQSEQQLSEVSKSQQETEAQVSEAKATQQENAQAELDQNQQNLNSEVESAKAQQEADAQSEVNAHYEEVKKQSEANQAEIDKNAEEEMQSAKAGAEERETMSNSSTEKQLKEQSDTADSVNRTKKDRSSSRRSKKKQAAEENIRKESEHTTGEIQKDQTSGATRRKFSLSETIKRMGTKIKNVIKNVGSRIASLLGIKTKETAATVTEATAETAASTAEATASVGSTIIGGIIKLIKLIPFGIGIGLSIAAAAAAVAAFAPMIKKLGSSLMKTVEDENGSKVNVGLDFSGIINKVKGMFKKGSKDAEKEAESEEEQSTVEVSEKEVDSTSSNVDVSEDEVSNVDDNNEEEEDNEEEQNKSFAEKQDDALQDSLKALNEAKSNNESSTDDAFAKLNEAMSNNKKNQAGSIEEYNAKQNESEENESEEESNNEESTVTSSESNAETNIKKESTNEESLSTVSNSSSNTIAETPISKEPSSKNNNLGQFGLMFSLLDKTTMRLLNRTMKSPIGRLLLNNPDKAANLFVMSSLLPITLGLGNLSQGQMNNLMKGGSSFNNEDNGATSSSEMSVWERLKKAKRKNMRTTDISNEKNKYGENASILGDTTAAAQNSLNAIGRLVELSGGIRYTDDNGNELSRDLVVSNYLANKATANGNGGNDANIKMGEGKYGKGKYGKAKINKEKSDKFLEASKYALNNEYKEPDGGMYPKYFRDYLGSKNINVEESDDNNKIKKLLSEGKPVILMGSDEYETGKNPFAKDPHYVVATGYDGENLIIEDSEEKNGSQLYNANNVLQHSNIKMITNKGKSKTGKGLFNRFKKYGKGKNKYGKGTIDIGNGLTVKNPEDVMMFWGYLQSKGLSDAYIAGIAGNIHDDSWFNSSGNGLLNWDDNAKEKIDYFIKIYKPFGFNSFAGQLFWIGEVASMSTSAFNAADGYTEIATGNLANYTLDDLNSKTPEECAEIFNQMVEFGFENGSFDTHRADNARAYYDTFATGFNGNEGSGTIIADYGGEVSLDMSDGYVGYEILKQFKKSSDESLYTEDLEQIDGEVITPEEALNGTKSNSSANPSTNNGSSGSGGSGGGSGGSGGSGGGSGGSGSGGSSNNSSNSGNNENSIEIKSFIIDNSKTIEDLYPKSETSYLINNVNITEDIDVKDILKYFKELNDIQDETLDVLEVVYNKLKKRVELV